MTKRKKPECTLTFKKCSDYEPEPLLWLWEDYLPTGLLTLVSGDSKAGKK